MLPKTASIQLRVVIVILATVLFAMAANWILYATTLSFSGELELWPLAMAAAACWFAVQLWNLKSWARKAMKVVIVLLIVIGILGVFNPFMAMDYAAEHGGETPDWMLLAAFVAPMVAVGLYCYWALDRYKDEFA